MAASSMMEEIIRQVEAGELQPGDALSATSKLAAAYDISCVTAHKAVQQLAKGRYCVRHPRRGTFISHNPKMAGITAVGIPAYFQAFRFMPTWSRN